MIDTTHANHVEDFSPTAEDFERLFARTTEQALAEREARDRAAAWPHDVEQALAAAAARIEHLDARVAALEAGLG